MPTRNWLLSFVTVLILGGCGPQPPETPRAAVIPSEKTLAGTSFSDPYAYLEIAGHQERTAYLEAEQQYFNRQSSVFEKRRDSLVTELNGQLPVSRQTRAVRSGRFMVYEEVPPGSQYPIYQRYPVGVPDAAKPVLDVNELAGGAAYFRLGDFATLDSDDLVAYTYDNSGDQQYTLKVSIIGGSDLPFSVSGVGTDITWQGDRVVYSKDGCVFALAPRTGRQSELTCETDPAYHIRLDALGDHVAVIAQSHDTTHMVVLPPDMGKPLEFAPREPGHRYSLHFRDDLFYVLTNRDAPEYKLALAQPGQSPQEWIDLLLPGHGLLVDVELLAEQIALHRRSRMMDSIWLDTGEKIAESSPGESLQLRRSPGPGLVEYVQRSYLHPDHYYIYDTASGDTKLVKEEPSAGNIDPDAYVVERRWYASGEVEVPVTVMYRKGAPLAARPMLVTGYAAYGITRLARFDPTLFTVLDRDYVLAVVHARGGGALGPRWHEDGRGQKKRNTFADFIAATEGLLADGVGDAARVAAMGASAGGTIMGVIANERPDLYRAIVARMPFVDLVTTLADGSHPLTPADRLEWGDPNDLIGLAYLRSYSPYVQVRPQAYPAMLVTAAANDARVPLYEPLKWMANLRANHTGQAPLLLNVQDEQGHLGATDQYERRQSKALEYAFIFSALDPVPAD